MPIDSIKTILRQVDLPKQINGGKYAVELKDTDISGNEYTFKISDVPQDTIIIRADKFPNTGVFFKGSTQTGICQKADYIIISKKSDGSSHRIIIIELTKGTSKDAKFIIKQLKGAKCILKYCESIIEHFFNKKDILKNAPIHYVAVVNAGGARKQGINYTNNPTKNQKVENFLKITSGKDFQFKYFVS